MACTGRTQIVRQMCLSLSGGLGSMTRPWFQGTRAVGLAVVMVNFFRSPSPLYLEGSIQS